MAQDRYNQWLRIKPGDRPPDHYTLLNLPRFCDDPDRIEQAAHEQLDKLDQYALSPDAENRAACQLMMNEVAQARVVLQDAIKRDRYNRMLAGQLGLAPPPSPVAPNVPAPAAPAEPAVLPVHPVVAAWNPQPSVSTPPPPTERWRLPALAGLGALAALLAVVLLLQLGGDDDDGDGADPPAEIRQRDFEQHQILAKQWNEMRERYDTPSARPFRERIDAAFRDAKTSFESGDEQNAKGILTWTEARLRDAQNVWAAREQYEQLKAKFDLDELARLGEEPWRKFDALAAKAAEADITNEETIRLYDSARNQLSRVVTHVHGVKLLADAQLAYEKELAKHPLLELKQTGPTWAAVERDLAGATADHEPGDRTLAYERALDSLKHAVEAVKLLPHLRELENNVNQSLTASDPVEMARTSPEEWKAVLAARERGKDAALAIPDRMKALEEARRNLRLAIDAAAKRMEEQDRFRKPFDQAMALYNEEILKEHGDDNWRQIESALQKAKQDSLAGRDAQAIAGYAAAAALLDSAAGHVRSKELIAPVSLAMDSTATADRIRFSPNGRQLAIVNDRSLRLWDVVTGQPAGREIDLVKNQNGLQNFVFSEDGEKITIVSGSGFSMFNLATGERVLQDPTRLRSPDSLRISANQAVAAYLMLSERLIGLWNFKAGKRVKHVNHLSPVRCIELSGDGEILVTTEAASADLRVWNTSSGLVVARHSILTASGTLIDGQGAKKASEYNPSLALSPDGQTIALLQDGFIQFFKTTTGKPTGVTIAKQPRVIIDGTLLEFSPDGNRLLVGFMSTTATVNGLKPGLRFARLYDPRNGKPVGAVFSPGYREGAAASERQTPPLRAYSPDGQFLAIAGDEAVLRVIRLSTGSQFYRNIPLNSSPLDLAFCPTARLIAVRRGDRARIELWSMDPVLRNPFAPAPPR